MENLMNKMKVRVVLHKLNIDEFKKNGQINLSNEKVIDNAGVSIFR